MLEIVTQPNRKRSLAKSLTRALAGDTLPSRWTVALISAALGIAVGWTIASPR